jgi:heme O synthase-like polyprenyltransferase
MRKERTLLILGIWVMILPFLGFPNTWKQIMSTITGIALIYLAYLYYHQAKSRTKKQNTMKSFVDNVDSAIKI